MTQNLFNDLSRVFDTDYPPIHAVGISQGDKVFVVADIYESYYPGMPKYERNRNYVSTSICELVDKGKYSGLRFVENYHDMVKAQIAFRDMAEKCNLRYARNKSQLNRILKKISITDDGDNAA